MQETTDAARGLFRARARYPVSPFVPGIAVGAATGARTAIIDARAADSTGSGKLGAVSG